MTTGFLSVGRDSSAKLLRTNALEKVVMHTERMWRFLKAIRSRQHRVAATTWVAAIAAVVYTFAPIDLIPELVLGPLGFVDDIGLWGISVVLFTREYHRWTAALDAENRAASVLSVPAS